jgi:hypothetical protein
MTSADELRGCPYLAQKENSLEARGEEAFCDMLSNSTGRPSHGDNLAFTGELGRHDERPSMKDRDCCTYPCRASLTTRSARSDRDVACFVPKGLAVLVP